MALPARLKSRAPAVNPAVAVWRRYEYERSDVIASPHALSRNWVCSIEVCKSINYRAILHRKNMLGSSRLYKKIRILFQCIGRTVPRPDDSTMSTSVPVREINRVKATAIFWSDDARLRYNQKQRME